MQPEKIDSPVRRGFIGPTQRRRADTGLRATGSIAVEEGDLLPLTLSRRRRVGEGQREIGSSAAKFSGDVNTKFTT